MTVEGTLLLYLGMAAVTYVSRRAFLRLPSRFFSPQLKNGLSFIPIGIFAALIFPSLFLADGQFVIQPLYLVASLVCLLLMAVTRNVFVSFFLSLLLVVLVSLGLLPFPW
ncbi:AzlD domain-containing protein [Brevibacillus humidisoli]|uniref:AzlD domain-containing protein n=1 Tax=Brevibacillus humidisoli TaxID=2895522 RepID=UPI001E54D8E4|nr:AzlD domain-containing protein [Brevibacillus humidisoli]UFJ41684.1 AzlD domain-containing protein [Brevibacillus humidisoli]